MRGSTLVGLGVLTLTLLGVTYLRIAGTESVWVVTSDLPAYYQVRQKDLRIEEVPRSEMPDDVVTDKDAIVGKYTLRSLELGDPVGSRALGPAAVGRMVDGLFIVALAATPAQVLDGELHRGDTIELLFAPRQNDEAVSLRTVPVLQVRKAGPAYVLTIGLTATQLTDFRAANWKDWSAVRSEAYMAP